MTDAKARLLQMIADEPHMGGGGLLKAVGKAQKVAKAKKAAEKVAKTVERVAAPQDEALRLAQKRAALPIAQGGLGLPANNTPAQRAAAMGINTNAYHGTKQNITGAFKPGYDDNLAFVTHDPEFANKWIGKGKIQKRAGPEGEAELKSAEDLYRALKEKHMDYESLNTNDPNFHAEYDKRDSAFKEAFAKDIGLYPDKTHSTVYPLMVQANKRFDPETDMDVMAEFFEKNNTPKQLQELYKGGNYLIYETKPVVDYLKSKGYDSMRLRESTGDDYPTTAVFDPESVRSRFAAFDPFRRNAATAAAMGVAAPDLLADEKKAAGGAVHMAGGGKPKPTAEELAAMRAKQFNVKNQIMLGNPNQFNKDRANQLYPKKETMNPIVKAAKDKLDQFNAFIDRGVPVKELVGGLTGAIPFVGPKLREDLESATVDFPLGFERLPGNEQVATGNIETAPAKVFDILDSLKMSDLTGGTGASSVLNSVGKGYMPDPLDLLDAASAAALGYGAIKGGLKAGVKGAGALSNLAKSDTGYKLAQKALDYVPAAQPMYAVKPKGGNWVDTEVKRQLDRLKNDEDYSPLLVNSSKQDLAEIEKNPSAYLNSAQQIEILRNDIARMEETNAFNKWVDTKVGSYIRNQMGTPDDPVVKSLDMRAMKAQADLEAGQKRLASLDSRIAEAEKTAVTPDELNQLAGMKRNRSQRAAELQSNYDLTLETMLPGGKSNEGYAYLRDSNPYLTSKRIEAGFPKAGLAQTRPGKAWEAATDANISTNPAEMFQNTKAKRDALQKVEDEYKNYRNVELIDKFRDFVNSQPDLSASTRRALIQGSSTKHMAEMVGDTERHEKLLSDIYQARRKVDNSSSDMAYDNPYLAKLAPETPVYMPNGISELDIDHVIDVLKQDVAAGNIKLEDLNKITMEQALKRMSEYDLDLAKKSRDSLGASRAAMPVYKEYPEGYRWVQLTKPGEFKQESEEMGHSVRGYEPPKGHPDWSPTSENSGSSMYGHGGWEAIKSGKAKVYSLVDADHKPHVTVEILSEGMTPEQRTYKVGILTQRLIDEGNTPEQAAAQAEKIYPEGENKQFITQIKGKQNRAPKEDYLPFVQDFVKGGQWSEVGDLRNTGLRDIKKTPRLEEYLKTKNADVPRYLTEDEYKGYESDFLLDELGKVAENDPLTQRLLNEQPRMAEGGEVKSFFEEKSAKQRLLDMIAEEPHMGISARPSRLQLQGEIANDTYGGIGGGGRATYTHPVGSDAAIRAYMEGGGYKPKDMDYKGQVNNMGISYEKEFKDGGEVHMAGGGLRTAITKAQKIAKAAKVDHPLVFPRAAVKTIDDIRPIAQRMAGQMTGEFVKQNPKVTTNPAGKSRKQFEQERSIPLETRNVVPERPAPDVNYEDYKGYGLVGVPGDPTMGGVAKRGSLEQLTQPTVELTRVGDITPDYPVPLFGGPRYGDEDKFWASNLGAAVPIQKNASKLAEKYQSPVLAKYIKMGSGSENFALHNLDALLSIQRPEKLDKAKMAQLTEAIQAGSPKYGKFPGFTGFKDPADVLLQAQMDSNLRKHIAETLTKPTITDQLGLPNGLDVVAAITYPELRNLETGASGFSVGKMKPGATLQRGQSSHPTYDTDIPGSFLGRSRYPTPYEIAFPDTTAYARSKMTPGVQEFNMMKMLGPRERIDQQYIDEIKMYEQLMKQYTGKKKGGLAHTKKVKRHGNTVSN